MLCVSARLNINDECEENIPKNLITNATAAIVVDDDDDDGETITDTKCSKLMNQKKLVDGGQQNGMMMKTSTMGAAKVAAVKGAAATGGNKTLTEYFQVRRSVRKTKKEVQEEKNRSIERAVIDGREDGLKVRMITYLIMSLTQWKQYLKLFLQICIIFVC